MKEYDRVILACGASNPRDIDVPGRDAQGIYYAVDFLKATTRSLMDSHLEDGNYITARDKHVVVIGGGDTGNDCVGTSIRHGCASVTQLEMMPKPPVKRRMTTHGRSGLRSLRLTTDRKRQSVCSAMTQGFTRQR